MAVLLIDPGQIFWPRNFTPLSINPAMLALRSFLQDHAIECHVLDFHQEPSLAPAAEEGDLAAFEAAAKALLETFVPDVIGISCFSTYAFQATLAVARVARRLWPSRPIAVGGWHALSEPHDFLFPDSPFDFVVTGQGETVLLDLATGQRQRTGMPEIVQSGALSAGEHEALQYHIEDFIRSSRYEMALRRSRRIMLPISRGCPHACRFCANSLIQDRTWTAWSVEKCIQLISDARSALPDLEVCYLGDAFFGPTSTWRRQFLTEIKRHHRDLPIVLITRTELLGPRDVELLAESRTFVVLGVESLSDTMLRIMNKTPRPDRYITKAGEVLENLREAQVPHEVFIILGHPGETEETSAETRERLSEFLRPGSFATPFRYMHLPVFARDAAEYRERFGTELRTEPRWWLEPRFHSQDELDGAYVPSRKPGESFASAQTRLEAALLETRRVCAPFERRREHVELLREITR